MNTVKKSQSESKSGREKTLLEYIYEIKEQVSFSEFEGTEEEDRAEELCVIMAKVMRLPDSAEISICGEKMKAAIVKETYSLITYTHICHVMENFSKIDYPVNNKISYLRTALFNSTDEAYHKIENDVNRWMKNDK